MLGQSTPTTAIQPTSFVAKGKLVAIDNGKDSKADPIIIVVIKTLLLVLLTITFLQVFLIKSRLLG
jgi:hypothetical protein